MIKKLLFGLSIALLASNYTYAQSEYVLKFDAATENQSIKYADDATSSIMDGATDYTIEMWVKPNENSVNGEVWLSMRNMFRITYFTNNRFYFTHKDGSGNNTFYNVNDEALVLNVWNHIAVICSSTDGDDGSIKLFVNGVDVSAESYVANTLVGGDANNDIFVGYGVGADYANMDAREVRIKNEAIDPSSFHIVLSDTNYGTDANTAAVFNFAEGTGITTVNTASSTNADLGFSGAHYPTWVDFDVNTASTSTNKIVKFSVYPNPATDIITVQSEAKITNISIYNILGKMVYNQTTSLTSINTSKLNAGIYILKVNTVNGIGSRKLVIK